MQQDKSAHFLPGIKNIVIDGFQFPLSIFPEQHQRHYFLTQYLQDHFQGLSPEWNQGHIYCSPITANALLNIMKFQTPSLVHSIEYNVPQILYDDIEFTFLDANHCPGSIMILFFCKSKNLYHLHTGMMKYSPNMKMYPALLQQQHQPQQLPQQQQLQLQSLNTASPLPPLAPSSSSTPSNSSSSQHIKIDSLLLDTTYAHPKHSFASMEIILKKIIDMITDFLQKGSSSSSSSSSNNNNNGIVFISPYGLGKEMILKTILQECPDQCIHIPDEYYEFYEQIPEYQPYYETNRIVRDRSMSVIHLVDQDFSHFTGSFFQPRFDRIHELIHVINEEKKMKHMNSTPELLTRALAILPSGWADTSNYQKVNPYQVKDQIHIQLLPFIEHSPYNDLVEFVKFIKPREVIPTVYADDKDKLYINQLFRSYIDRSANIKKYISKLEKSQSRLNQKTANNANGTPSNDQNINHKKRKSHFELSADDIARIKSSLGNDYEDVRVINPSLSKSNDSWIGPTEAFNYFSSSNEEDLGDEEEIDPRDQFDLFEEGRDDGLLGPDTTTFMVNPLELSTESAPRPDLQKQLSFSSQYGIFAPTGMSKIFDLGVKDAVFNLRIQIPDQSSLPQQQQQPQPGEDDQLHSSNSSSRSGTGRHYNIIATPVPFDEQNPSPSHYNSGSPSSLLLQRHGSISQHPTSNPHRLSRAGSTRSFHHKRKLSRMDSQHPSTPGSSTPGTERSLTRRFSTENNGNNNQQINFPEASDMKISPLHAFYAATETPMNQTRTPLNQITAASFSCSPSSPMPLSSSSPSNRPQALSLLQPVPSFMDNEIAHMHSPYRAVTSTKRGKVLKQMKLHEFIVSNASSPSNPNVSTPGGLYLESNQGSPSGEQGGNMFDKNFTFSNGKTPHLIKKKSSFTLGHPKSPRHTPASTPRNSANHHNSPAGRVAGEDLIHSRTPIDLTHFDTEESSNSKLNSSPIKTTDHVSPRVSPIKKNNNLLVSSFGSSFDRDSVPDLPTVAPAVVSNVPPSPRGILLHSGNQKQSPGGKVEFILPKPPPSSNSGIPTANGTSYGSNNPYSYSGPAPSTSRCVPSTARGGGRRSNFSTLTPIDPNAVLGLLSSVPPPSLSSSNMTSLKSEPLHTPLQLSAIPILKDPVSLQNASDEIAERLSLATIDEKSMSPDSIRTTESFLRAVKEESDEDADADDENDHHDEVEVVYTTVQVTSPSVNSKIINGAIWICAHCTYRHEGKEFELYLQCKVCGLVRNEGEKKDDIAPKIENSLPSVNQKPSKISPGNISIAPRLAQPITTINLTDDSDSKL